MAVFDNKSYSTPVIFVTFGIAAICVLTRIIMQFISPVFTTKSMRLQFQYCVALFGHYVVIPVGRFLRPNTLGCAIVAILENYLFLTSFVWMAILSLDMYNNLRNLKNPTQKVAINETNLKKFRDIAIETAIGWGATLPVTILGITLDNVDSIDEKFKQNFGKSICFAEPIGIEHFPYYAATFITFVIDVVVFIRTALFLRKAFDRRRQLTLRNRYYFGSYVKLLIMMGINYTLVLFIPFFDNIFLWIVTAAAHTFQGVYIAATFVLTRKVWKSLQNAANKSESNRVDRCQRRSEPSTPSFIVGSCAAAATTE